MKVFFNRMNNIWEFMEITIYDIRFLEMEHFKVHHYYPDNIETFYLDSCCPIGLIIILCESNGLTFEITI
jgi:hypothetical protein